MSQATQQPIRRASLQATTTRPNPYPSLYEDEDGSARSKASTRSVVRRSSLTVEPVTRIKEEPKQTQKKQGSKYHWLVWVGIAMCVMLLGYVLVNALSVWVQGVKDDVTYGKTRTYQTDQAVGHNDSSSHPSHFIALNLRGKIEVIEIQGGDPSKTKIYYVTSLTPDQATVPVTLSFLDMNSDNRVDMLVSVGDKFSVGYINTGTEFKVNSK